jgi:hypothetical protein
MLNKHENNRKESRNVVIDRKFTKKYSKNEQLMNGGGGGGGGGGGRRRRRRRRRGRGEEEVEEEKVSLGVIMTNTEIFHIFHIISLWKESRNVAIDRKFTKKYIAKTNN